MRRETKERRKRLTKINLKNAARIYLEIAWPRWDEKSENKFHFDPKNIAEQLYDELERVRKANMRLIYPYKSKYGIMRKLGKKNGELFWIRVLDRTLEDYGFEAARRLANDIVYASTLIPYNVNGIEANCAKMIVSIPPREDRMIYDNAGYLLKTKENDEFGRAMGYFPSHDAWKVRNKIEIAWRGAEYPVV
jgi:hypothetical protein